MVITTPDRIDQEWIAKLANEAIISRIDAVGVIQAGIELVQQSRPDIVILDRELDQSEACIRQIFTNLPYTQCIGIIASSDIAAFRRLVTAGARDVLIRPARYSDLVGSIQSVALAELDRRARAQTKASPEGTGYAGRGRLIVVTSPKGGTGTTTIATNIAIALRQISASRVALADFGLQFGDVGVQLNLWSKHTLYDLLTRIDEIDDAMLQPVIQHHASGVHVLLAPNSPDAAGEISSEQIQQLLDYMLERYTYVVADTWSFLDEISSTLLQRADEILVIATPEVPTLKNVKHFLEFAKHEKLMTGKLTLVLNRFPSINGIALEDVQQHLRQSVGANIPSEGRLVTHSINRGIPVVVSNPESWVAQSLTKLAAHIAGEQIDTISLAPELKKAKGKAQSARQRWSIRSLIGGNTAPSKS